MPGKDSRHFPVTNWEALETGLLGFAPTRALLPPAEVENPATVNQRTHALYYGVGLREDLTPDTRGTDDQVHAWPGVWVDLDYGTVGHAGRSYPPDDAAALEIADRFPLAPSVVVHSGHGFHLYWLFDQPFFADAAGLRKRFASILTGVQRKFRELAQPFAVDKTDDVGRVLGLPGLWNCKALTPPVKATIFLDDGPRYQLTAFDAFRGQIGRPPKSPPPAVVAELSKDATPSSTPKPSDDSGRPFSEGEGPVPKTGAGGRRAGAGRPSDKSRLTDSLCATGIPWLEGVIQRVLNTQDVERKRRAILALTGQPFAEAGERNNICNSVVGLLSNYVFRERPESTPDEIYDTFFARAIDAMAQLEDNPANPALHKDDVLGQISRMWSVVVEEAEREKAQAERVKEGLRRGALRRRGSSGGDSGAGGAAGSNGTNGTNGHGTNGTNGTKALVLSDVALVDGEFVYDTDDGLPPVPPHGNPGDELTDEELFRLLIIQYKEVFWIWNQEAGAFGPSRSHLELEIAVRDELANIGGATWYTEDENGKVKRKTLLRFRSDYSTVADRFIYDLTARATEYDIDAKTLFVAAAPLRDLTPTFHPGVQSWLELLGGDQADKLLDWVATITDLTRPSCALYISGPPGAGKSMLADGLARLWNPHGGPTSLKHVLSHFNADLLTCPLIHADERLPVGTQTTELRDLVASSTRKVSAKYMPNAELRGAIRLLLTSNPPTLLETSTEHQGHDDVAAVATRFLHIPTTQKPVLFLEKLGGRQSTEGWVDKDIIAKHALWLRDCRSVSTAGRFLVEGHKTEMHRSLVVAGPVTALVLEWITKFLMRPMPNVVQNQQVVCGNGKLLVSTLAITEHWEHYISSHPVYSTTRIGRAMHSIASPIKTEKRRYWDIDLAFIYDWASTNNVGDVEQMMERIDTPNEALN